LMASCFIDNNMLVSTLETSRGFLSTKGPFRA
jgi:hypothetical protein